MYILAMDKVDMLMRIVRSDTDEKELENVIALLKGRSPAEQQGYDPAIEQIALINARLDKLEKGQDEILHILQAIKNK